MNAKRREVLKQGGGVTLLTLLAAAGWLAPGAASGQTWNKDAFETHSLDETMKALGGGAPVHPVYNDRLFVRDIDTRDCG